MEYSSNLCMYRVVLSREIMRIALVTLLLVCALFGCSATVQTQSTATVMANTVLSVTPGSPIYAEATINNDGSIMLVKVDRIRDPKNTVTFDFSKSDNGMMLSVKNPLDKEIKYHLDMIDFKGNPHITSTCPVGAGRSAFEMWPHPIPELRVSNVHVALNSEQGICIY